MFMVAHWLAIWLFCDVIQAVSWHPYQGNMANVGLPSAGASNLLTVLVENPMLVGAYG